MATPQQERQLKHIEAISQNARTSWFGLLGLLVFVGVTLMGHKDADFFAYGAATQLPLVGIEVPPTAFFIGAPILTAALYIYLHLYLFNLWDALGEIGPVIYDEDNQKEPLSARIHPTMMALAALRYRARTRAEEDGRCCQPLPLGWAVEAITYVLVWGFGVAILTWMWWRTMPAHDPWLTSLNGLCLFLALMTGVRGMYVFAMRLGHADRDEWANTPIQWAGISTAAFCIALVSIAHSGALPFSGINIARADLREAEITARPKDWLDYDEWKKEYEYTFRRREGYPEPMELPPEKQRELDEERPIRWAARVDDIDSLSLEGRDLRRANMERAFLAGADLRAAQLQGAQLPGARLDGADLRLAQMTGANLSGARLEGADLSCDWETDRSNPEACTNLKGAELGEARMEGADLSNARMEGADLSYARLEGAFLIGARLEGANLSSVQMEGANLSGAQMEGANLSCDPLFFLLIELSSSCTNLKRVDLRGARMEGADLSDLRLDGADLSRARMEGVNLRRARMAGADLSGAQMEGAFLFGAGMVGVNLRGALIRSAGCTAAVFVAAAVQAAEFTCDTMTQADLTGVVGNARTLLPDGLHVMSCLRDEMGGVADALALVPDDRRDQHRDFVICKPGEKPHATGVWAFEKRYDPGWWQWDAKGRGHGIRKAN